MFGKSVRRAFCFVQNRTISNHRKVTSKFLHHAHCTANCNTYHAVMPETSHLTSMHYIAKLRKSCLFVAREKSFEIRQCSTCSLKQFFHSEVLAHVALFEDSATEILHKRSLFKWSHRFLVKRSLTEILDMLCVNLQPLRFQWFSWSSRFSV